MEIDVDEQPSVVQLKAQLDDAEARALRALADFDNVRKRFGREVERVRLDERARVAAEWLPVIDNLELALAHADNGPFAEGVRAVRDEALAVFERLGYPRIDEVGAVFDPERHEVVGTMPADDENPPGTVVDITRAGYGSEDRLLRPASVIVAVKSPAPGE